MALMNCPECNKQISDSAKNCVHCGAKVTRCPECGQACIGEPTACGNCGFPLRREARPEPVRMERPSAGHPVVQPGNAQSSTVRSDDGLTVRTVVKKVKEDKRAPSLCDVIQEFKTTNTLYKTVTGWCGFLYFLIFMASILGAVLWAIDCSPTVLWEVFLQDGIKEMLSFAMDSFEASVSDMYFGNLIKGISVMLLSIGVGSLVYFTPKRILICNGVKNAEYDLRETLNTLKEGLGMSSYYRSLYHLDDTWASLLYREGGKNKVVAFIDEFSGKILVTLFGLAALAAAFLCDVNYDWTRSLIIWGVVVIGGCILMGIIMRIVGAVIKRIHKAYIEECEQKGLMAEEDDTETIYEEHTEIYRRDGVPVRQGSYSAPRAAQPSKGYYASGNAASYSKSQKSKLNIFFPLLNLNTSTGGFIGGIVLNLILGSVSVAILLVLVFVFGLIPIIGWLLIPVDFVVGFLVGMYWSVSFIVQIVMYIKK